MASEAEGAGTRGSGPRELSRYSPPPLLPVAVRSHGPTLPYGRGPQQGPQSDQEREQAQAQPTPRASDQTHQVRAGHDSGGVWLCPVRAARHGVTEGLQGQTGPQIYQEKGGDAHPRQEEAGGAEQRTGRHEESCCQERLSPSPALSLK
uniref:RPL36 alternative reading frame protein n=1 Tax=Homo sapiens TaxID=9606 RepID=ALT36_HUMAN